MLTLNVLYSIITLFFITTVISTYYAIKFALIVIKVEDAIEESLDILDDRYSAISKIAETPVFFDSVEVRSVISELNTAKESILLVANVLSSFAKKQEFYAQESKEDKKEKEVILRT